MNRRGVLQSSVSVLASSAEKQAEYLNAQGFDDRYGLDELVLEFDDIALARDDMLMMGEIDKSEYDMIALVQMYISELTALQDYGVWERSSLSTDARWQHLRAMADKLLNKLN